MQFTQEAVDNFFNQKKVAVFGVSRDGKKFGNAVFDEMRQRDYTVYAVNPNGGGYGNTELYSSLTFLPEQVDAAVVVVPKTNSLQVVKDAVEAGIKHIWVQQKSETAEIAEYCRDKDVNLINGKCVFMHMQPVKSVHAVHRWFMKAFGKLPA